MGTPGAHTAFLEANALAGAGNDRQGPHGNRNPRRSPVPTHAGKNTPFGVTPHSDYKSTFRKLKL